MAVGGRLLTNLAASLTLVPRYVTFTVITRLSPLIKLCATTVVYLVATLLNNHPKLVDKTTKDITMIDMTLIMGCNIRCLFLTIVLVKVVRVLINCFGLTGFVQLIPRPIICNFLGKLTVVVFLSRFGRFGASTKT